jgi:insertion element IS1 protein InsB
VAQLGGPKKNACWVWLAVDRDRRQVLDTAVGGRDVATGEALFRLLRHHPFERVCTDYFAAYPRLVPVHLHARSKADTASVEGCNSWLRHYLARFRRRGKCYSKCATMRLLSVLLFRAKKNGTLATLW